MPTHTGQPLAAPADDAAGHDIQARLQGLHLIAQGHYAFVDRIAMALYDPAVDLLKTFVSSNGDGDTLARYEAHLVDVPSLQELAHTRRTRVVDDISTQFTAPSAHTEWLKSQRYRASYTLPVYSGDRLAAFLFFDSRTPGVFTPAVTAYLDLFAEVAAQLYLLRQSAARTLIGAVNLACGLTGQRDSETGQHLRRIGLYARLIARRLAPRLALSDEYVEYVHLFAPLHDIGKVGIPDSILRKPGPLTPMELTQMRGHVRLGEQMVDRMIDDLALGKDRAAQIMRNIVAGHHERCDGSGYPRGLTGDQIALEARIVAVADVYDALSVERSYKPAWTPDRYAAELRRQAAAGMLDSGCVEALLADPAACAEIQARFADPHAAGGDTTADASRADVIGLVEG
jgi:HD-GYP domain-containing protein (c-di-GMP phosphodiesterase class II)